MRGLKEQGIAVRVSERASTRIDMEQRGLGELVRASVHYYNTEEEIERLCDSLRAWMRKA
jgi:cysteine desulfurase / selenocysteine lyase